ISRQSGVVARKEACRSEAVAQLADIRGARHYVVSRVKRVETEFIANAELNPSGRHELHQAHCAARRDRMLLSGAFDLHDRTDAARRHVKASGGFRDEVGITIGGWRTHRAVCACPGFEE